MVIECDRCSLPESVVYADTFCIYCEHVPLCIDCFQIHLVEITEELVYEKKKKDRINGD